MKFSIITPEHDPKNVFFLLELYESIKEQTYTNWEWIIYLNGKCKPEHIPDDIKNDERVFLHEAAEESNFIGHIKNRAFNLGTGDVLVEVDHDDMITPDCLQELCYAFQDNSVGFVYSDNAVLHVEDKFIPYDPSHGWTYRMFNWKGKELYAMNGFKPSSHAIGYIWFSPDHVRAWRTSEYHRIGGYDEKYEYCDDHELLIRTYLNMKMVHVPKVLYIYRITGVNNSLTTKNAEIQVRTRQLFNKHIRTLAEKEAEYKGLMCIDIGGGLNPYPGYTTVDLRENADYVCDLNNGIPLPDNSVFVLNASHIIEHLHDKTKIMSEIHRVLAPGGWAFIDVPSTDGRGAFQDPTHVSYWNENCFLYYTDAYLAQFIDNTTIRFMEYRRETYFPNEWMKNMNSCVTTAWLVAIKDDMPRLPGILKI
jgi:glycosyltransferase involved in cell wall biosynthesis